MEEEHEAGILTYRYVYGLEKSHIVIYGMDNNGNLFQPFSINPDPDVSTVKYTMNEYGEWEFESSEEFPLSSIMETYNYSDPGAFIPFSSGLNSGTNIVKLYYHHDRLGSTDFLTSNIDGKVISYISRDDWGQPDLSKMVLKTGSRMLNDLVLQYTVHQYDLVLDVYYAQARMYDAANHRFTAMDPIKGSVFNPITLNQYLYVADNPLFWIDVYGLEKIVISGNKSGTNATRNFIEPAIKLIRSWFSGTVNESITWIIVDDGYDKNAKNSIQFAIMMIYNDFESKFYKWDSFKKPDNGESAENYLTKVRLHNIDCFLRVIWVSSKEDLYKHINIGFDPDLDRNKEKISQLVVFSHGVPGTLLLGSGTARSANISISDVTADKIDKNAFRDDYFAVFYSCNAGTQSNESSFTQIWADVTGGYTIGIKGVTDAKTEYRYINENRGDLWNFMDSIRRNTGTPIDVTGSAYYPIVASGHPGTWLIYQKGKTPIIADSIMSRYNVPLLGQIKALAYPSRPGR